MEEEGKRAKKNKRKAKAGLAQGSNGSRPTCPFAPEARKEQDSLTWIYKNSRLHLVSQAGCLQCSV